MTSVIDRASLIPGRSLTRSKKVFGRFADWASKAIICDTDGRKYIDMLCGLGAVSIGYGCGLQFRRLGVCSLPYDDEGEAADAVLRHVAPWASWVRFTKTGSEATHAAYRIAKAATGRQNIIRFDGTYHGWHEWCDQPTGRYSLNADLGMLASLKPAAVFVEPHRFEPVSLDWLKDLRRWCDHLGSLLVFDSMIYGGRWHLQGASGYFGVQPDLECFGKAYGNGQAVAFVVGTERTYQHGEIASGTFSGELSGLNAVISTLDTYLSEPVIDTMWARGRQLRAGMDAVVPLELGHMVGEVPCCQYLKFHDPAHPQQFCEAMRDRGVLWHPLVVLTMAAHTEEQIDQVVATAKEALETLR